MVIAILSELMPEYRKPHVVCGKYVPKAFKDSRNIQESDFNLPMLLI